MSKILIGSLLSAVALMVYGFVFWATPVSNPGFGEGANIDALQTAISDAVPESGTYVIPNPYIEDQDLFVAQHERGPVGILHIQKEGSPAMQPSVFIIGFIHNFVTAMILAILLQMAIPALPTYGGRVMFCTICGVFAAVWENFTGPIWFASPWAFYVVRSIYTIIGMTIVGAILAKFVRR